MIFDVKTAKIEMRFPLHLPAKLLIGPLRGETKKISS